MKGHFGFWTQLRWNPFGRNQEMKHQRWASPRDMVLSPKGEKNHGKHVFYQFTIYLPYISIINPLSKNGCALFSDAVIANSEDRQPPGKPPRNEIAEENVTLLRGCHGGSLFRLFHQQWCKRQFSGDDTLDSVVKIHLKFIQHIPKSWFNHYKFCNWSYVFILRNCFFKFQISGPLWGWSASSSSDSLSNILWKSEALAERLALFSAAAEGQSTAQHL